MRTKPKNGSVRRLKFLAREQKVNTHALVFWLISQPEMFRHLANLPDEFASVISLAFFRNLQRRDRARFSRDFR